VDQNRFPDYIEVFLGMMRISPQNFTVDSVSFLLERVRFRDKKYFTDKCSFQCIHNCEVKFKIQVSGAGKAELPKSGGRYISMQRERLYDALIEELSRIKCLLISYSKCFIPEDRQYLTYICKICKLLAPKSSANTRNLKRYRSGSMDEVL
jgi:hypothetical protein